MKARGYLIGGICIGTLLLFAAGHFLITPLLLRIPNDFFYSASMLSLDNLYDVDDRRFIGEQRSVAQFNYSKQAVDSRESHIEAEFYVRTIQGDEIIHSVKEYAFDRYLWSRQDENGERVYLFGPRHAVLKERFYYSHPNYQSVLEMEFEGEDSVLGLRTRKYHVDFTEDQTQLLQHIEGVPERYSMQTDVSLTIWIEPVTGWLVKYKDEGIVYYVDNQTGERLYPWNTFRNSFAQSSIADEVQIAKQRRFVSYFGDWILPGLSALLLYALFLWRRKETNLVFFSGGIVVLVVLMYGIIVLRPLPVDRQFIGIAPWFSQENTIQREFVDAFVNSLEANGYGEKEVDVQLRYANGSYSQQERIALDFLVNDADLIVTLAPEGTESIARTIFNIPIVFSFISNPVQLGLIDSMSVSRNNLVGTVVRVSGEESLELILSMISDARRIGFVRFASQEDQLYELQKLQRLEGLYDVEIVDVSVDAMNTLELTLREYQDRYDVLLVSCGVYLVQGADAVILDYVEAMNIPSFTCSKEGVENGHLAGLVNDVATLGKISGEKAALLLNGASPSSLETGSVARPYLYLNMERAEVLGIPVSQQLLTRAKQIFHAITE